MATEFKPLHTLAHTGGDLALAFGMDDERGACWLLGSEVASAAAACGRAIFEGQPITFRVQTEAVERLREISALLGRSADEGFDVKHEKELIQRALAQREA